MRSSSRFSRAGIAAIGVLGFAFAVVAAGCGGTNGNSQTSTVPDVSQTANPSTICAEGTGGVIYIPDANVSANQHGITIQPFEKTDGTFVTTCATRSITASSAVNEIATSAFGDGIAVMANGAAVGLNGLNGNGNAYFTPFSTANLTYSSTALAAADITSAVVLPQGTLGIAVDAETPAPGPTAGLISINNILGNAPAPLPTPAAGASPTPTPTVAPNATATAFNPPIAYPAQIPYTSIGVNPTSSPQSTGLAITNGSQVGRPTVALGPDGQTLLVRGDTDLLALQVAATAGGYFITYPEAGSTGNAITTGTAGTGISTTLGYPQGLTQPNYARGLIAFSPTTASRALIGGVNGNTSQATNNETVTLLYALPSNLTDTVTYTGLKNPVTSLAINTNGNTAAVGTTNGLTILQGVAGGALTAVVQSGNFSTLNYIPAGQTVSRALGSVISVAFSSDGKYLIVLANDGSGKASILAYAVDGNGNLTTPVSGPTALAAAGLPVTLGAEINAPANDSMVVR